VAAVRAGGARSTGPTVERIELNSIMMEYSSILCLNTMDFLASNRQQQQQQKQQLKKAVPAGGKSHEISTISGRILRNPIPISCVTISGYTCPDIRIS
jgi:hypothetical protein